MERCRKILRYLGICSDLSGSSALSYIHLWHTGRLKWFVVYMRHYIPVKAAHMDLTETVDWGVVR